jgi:hypothetical protein
MRSAAAATPPAASTRATVHASIASIVPVELAEGLLNEYDELNARFHLSDFRPSELSGGRFSEAAFRICESVCLATHTPVGKSLPRVDTLLQRLETAPAGNVDDTFRLHIPRTLRLIYDLRNKRDVAHLGAGVSPNFTDASLVLTCASWVVSEIVRVAHKCDIATAQAIVDSLIQRRVPLVWAEDEVVRVLDATLSFRDQVLLLLYHFQPQAVDERKLFEWVEYSQLPSFRAKVLARLHAEALIDYRGGKARILPPGNKFVEDNLKGGAAT